MLHIVILYHIRVNFCAHDIAGSVGWSALQCWLLARMC